MEIRQARQDDVHQVYILGENVDEFHTSDQVPNFWPEAVLNNCIDKEDVYFLVAEVQNKIVGFIIANCNRSLGKTLIENIFVSPEMRGHGIGSRLAAKVVDAAKADGYQFISVLTPPDDVAAVATYEKVGFAKGETFPWLDIA